MSSLGPENYVAGQPCPRGCGVPTMMVHRDHPNIAGPPYHDCPRRPERALAWLLVRLGSLTSARFDQHVRGEMGDAAAADLLDWLDRQGVDTAVEAARPARVRPEPAAFPIGCIRRLDNGQSGIVEEDASGVRFVRWGTCAHCPTIEEGPARGGKRPWLCENYDRPDHKLRAELGEPR